MKILHVLDHSLPDVDGYALRSHAILLHQRRMGLEPHAITSIWQRSAGGSCDVIHGVPYHRTAVPPEYFAATVGRERERIFGAALRERVLERARSLRAVLVHAHSPASVGRAACLAARRAGLPVVYEVRASWEDAAVDRGRLVEDSAEYHAARETEARLAAAVDGVVAISRGIRDDLVRRGVPEGRITVVPNGVDPVAFVPRPPNAALARSLGLEGKSVVAYLGSLFRFEGVTHLLDAFAALCGERDDVRALVVGDGEMRSALEAQAARLGLGDRIVFTGRVAPELVAGLQGLADVVCYPRERCRLTDLTTPLKPLEAMSMAKAIVASDVGGHRELLEHGRTALLVRPADPADLRHALEVLLADPDHRARLGAAARAEVVASRSWRRVVRRHADVYAAAVESSRARERRLSLDTSLIAGEST